MRRTLTVTEKLLLSLINPCAEKREIEALLSDAIDWRYFQEKSYAHRIAPLIYYNLKSLGFLPLAPKQTIKILEKAYIQTSRVNMLLGQELKGILDAFGKRGIFCIILKGLAFTETVYRRNPALRPARDIDLLLRKDDVKKAGLVLEEMGYQFNEEYQTEAFFRESHFHLPFEKKGESINFIVELHWHLVRPDLPVNLDVERFWQRVVEIDFWGAKAGTLHPEDALIYLIWHMSWNYFYELLSLADLLYLIKYHKISWDNIIKQVKRAELKIPLYWTSHITARLFNLDFVPALPISALSRIFARIYFNEKNIMEQLVLRHWSLRFLIHFFMFKNKLYRLK